MKTASAPLISLLASRKFCMADIYTITLTDGTILRYADLDIDVVYSANIYTRMAIKRGTTKTKIGIEVDTFNFTIFPKATDLVTGTPFLSATRQGIFDGAMLQMDRAFASSWPTIVGVVNQFYGLVSDVSAGRTEAEFSVKSALELLNQPMPRNVYQAVCLHTVYDGGCGLVKATYTVAGATAGTITTTSFGSSGAPVTGKAAGYFDQGVLKFTSGALTGISRTIKSFDGSGVFSFALPWPSAPASGDAFSVYPGCDKTMATCGGTKFANNLARFKGYPFIPVPETTI